MRLLLRELLGEFRFGSSNCCHELLRMFAVVLGVAHVIIKGFFCLLDLRSREFDGLVRRHSGRLWGILPTGGDKSRFRAKLSERS